MKKLFISIFITAVLAAVSLPINLNAQTIPTDGLLAYYPFNGNANDESGNNKNGTVSGAMLDEDRFGSSNSAYSFDGVNDYIATPSLFNHLDETFSISGWVFPKGEDGTSHSPTQYVFQTQFQTRLQWTELTTNNSYTFRSESGDNSTIYRYYTPDYFVLPNSWYHFAMVKSTTDLKIFINGIPFHKTDIHNYQYGSTYQFVFGASYVGSTALNFNGKLDDFRIYNRTLTEEEIQILYQENGYNLNGGSGSSSVWSSDNSSNINYSDGNVAIGTADPKGYKLAVAGKMIVEEVDVLLQSDWPDYVFENDYNLKPLTEVEEFIKENKHLPDLPSDDEVKEKGISIGEIQAKLLKKIEELTLYTIEQEKRFEMQDKKLKELQKQYSEISSQNTELKKQITKLIKGKN